MSAAAARAALLEQLMATDPGANRELVAEYVESLSDDEVEVALGPAATPRCADVITGANEGSGS